MEYNLILEKLNLNVHYWPCLCKVQIDDRLDRYSFNRRSRKEL